MHWDLHLQSAKHSLFPVPHSCQPLWRMPSTLKDQTTSHMCWWSLTPLHASPAVFSSALIPPNNAQMHQIQGLAESDEQVFRESPVSQTEGRGVVVRDRELTKAARQSEVWFGDHAFMPHFNQCSFPGMATFHLPFKLPSNSKLYV